jgi:hypothetical protein
MFRGPRFGPACLGGRREDGHGLMVTAPGRHSALEVKHESKVKLGGADEIPHQEVRCLQVLRTLRVPGVGAKHTDQGVVPQFPHHDGVS